MKKSYFFVNSFLSCVLRNNKTFLPSGARTPIDYIVINFTYCVVLRGSPIEGQFLHLLLTMILLRIRKTLSFSFCYISKQCLVPFCSLRICVLYIAIQRKTKCLCIQGMPDLHLFKQKDNKKSVVHGHCLLSFNTGCCILKQYFQIIFVPSWLY